MSSGSKRTHTSPLSPPSHIPHELLFSQILPRLAAEPLLRFSSVSKLWCSTIADPKFVASHFLRSKTNPLLLGIFSFKKETSKYLVFNLNRILVEQFDGSMDLEKFSKTKIGGPSRMLIGNCNGLICFRSYFYFESSETTENPSVIRLGLEIFNPVTREILAIPLPNADNKVTDTVCGPPYYGFCFDSLRNEYKVVCICTDKRRTMVYTLGTNSWRSATFAAHIPDVSNYSASERAMVIDGTLYWYAYNSDENDKSNIISFDTHSEELLIIPAPTCGGSCERIFERKGYLCLASYYYSFIDNEGFLYLYMLNKENDNRHCWAKEKIILPHQAANHRTRIGAVDFFSKFLLHWIDDEELLTLCNLHSGTQKLVKLWPNIKRHAYAILYHVENLLSLETFVPPGESEVVCVSSRTKIAPHFIEEVLLHSSCYGYQ